MARLKLHLLEAADFNKFIDAKGGTEALFVPGNDTPQVGSAVTVEVVFQGGPRVLLHGHVTWRRATGNARARPGVGVSIGAAEQPKMSFLLGYVRGGLLDVRGRRRLPVRLRVAYTGPRGRRINFTRDLHEEGCFVRASELLDLGAETRILITPPGEGYKPIEVAGAVARLQADGADRGMGIRFAFVNDDERRGFATFVQKLESDYLDGALPDEALL